MIILHRLTIIAQSLLVAAVFWALLHGTGTTVYFAIGGFGLFSLLQIRLLGFDYRSWSFWIFFISPLLFLLATLLFFLFLESSLLEWSVAFIAIALTWVYLENLFTFYYTPGTYQPYALEYLSLAMYLLTIFFFASGMYAAQVFLLMPLWIPAITAFVVFLCASICMFWVSKVSAGTSLPYAISGAIGFTELYLTFSFLPTSFVVNAAALTVCFYLFLGLVRARVLEELTPAIIKRYTLTSLIALILIFASAQWS